MKSKQTWQIMHIQITYKQSKITYTLQPPKDSHLLYHFNSSSENSRHMTSKGHGHKIFLHTRRHFIWSKQIWSLEMPQANLRLEIEYLRILQFQSFLHPIFSYINEITVQQSISMIRCSAERTQTVMIKKAMASENLKRTACELGRRMKPQRWQLDSQFDWSYRSNVRPATGVHRMPPFTAELICATVITLNPWTHKTFLRSDVGCRHTEFSHNPLQDDDRSWGQFLTPFTITRCQF